ncbi:MULTISPECIES: class A sortase [Enterococcus]|uniref:class A sortase n=1 Tax=Enterococcus TaxID=1350 RepID=UPI00209D7D90|nr:MULTISPECIES: class A sortase [Enterococcus]MDT2427163.1 class A sortase [Enterococcus avium]
MTILRKIKFSSIVCFLLLVVGLMLIFNNQIKTFMISRQTETNRISQYTVSDVEKNLKKKANYDFDSVKSIDSEMVLKEQFKNNDLPVIGGINIPEVKIELPILKGVDNKVLLTGAGTLKEEQKMGEGNYALASHRTSDPKLLFTPLDDVSIDTRIYLTDLKKIYIYKVVMKKIVDPSQVQLIDDVEAKKLVTLVTCGDIEGNTRLVVQGEIFQTIAYQKAPRKLKMLFEE